MSAHDIGIGRSLSWAEAVQLVDAALADTGTELFAAMSGWRFPLSMPLMLLVTSAYGKNSEKVMPWYGAGPRVSDEELAAVHAELLDEIRFT